LLVPPVVVAATRRDANYARHDSWRDRNRMECESVLESLTTRQDIGEVSGNAGRARTRTGAPKPFSEYQSPSDLPVILPDRPIGFSVRESHMSKKPVSKKQAALEDILISDPIERLRLVSVLDSKASLDPTCHGRGYDLAL
jgi:hypothetical protein